MTQKKKKVAVLMGGWSAEREVSLVSGGAVCKALESLGHEVLAIDVQRDPMGIVQTLALQAGGKPDVVFNALHGRGGEDGTVQGLLNFIGIPYTHSGVLASAAAMHKPVMKVLAAHAGVRSPKGVTRARAAIVKEGYSMEPPFVLKPINEGSSVGVKLVMSKEDVDAIEEDGWIYGDEVLIEEFIPGRELTVAVLGHGAEAKALAVTELCPKGHAFYDYTAKYSDGQTDHLIPAPLPRDIYDEAMKMALAAYRAAGCQGAARADLRWDESKKGTEGLYFLEINTQPGLTPLSLLPEQARYAGLSFDDLIQWMLDHPLCHD